MRKYQNIVAITFSGIGVYLFDKIWGDDIDWKEFQELDIGKLLLTSVTILDILIFLVLLSIAYFTLSKIFSKDASYEKKQNKLRKFNNITEKETGILFRWKVYFDFSGEPFISDLDGFCTKHPGPPRKLIHGRCPIPDCSNNRQPANLSGAENYIESDLVNRWSKIKN